MKKVVIPIVIVAAIVVIVGFVPIVQVPYPVTVQYQDTETYYEDEPYEETETYVATVQLSYEVTDSYIYDDTYTYTYTTQVGGFLWEGTEEVPIEVAGVDIKNTDDVAGTFTVHFSGFTPMFFSSTELDLSPGEEKTASCPSEYDIDEWDYRVSPDTKEVERERTVTKYRQVERERTVTRERVETRYKRVSIFEYLRSRF
jgi:hypothetical protein